MHQIANDYILFVKTMDTQNPLRCVLALLFIRTYDTDCYHSEGKDITINASYTRYVKHWKFEIVALHNGTES